MPIEIKELHIKATISDPGDDNSGGGNSGGNGEEPNDQLINTCVEKVLQILNDKADR